MTGPAKQFKKRNAILECLRETRLHPSAEMVQEMLHQDHPDISLATIYRNLSRFRTEGLIQCVATVRGKERYDANTDPHVHFICEGCDSIIDLPQIEVPQSLSGRVEEVSGCRPRDCQLTFTGLCGSCHQAKEKIC